jgi:hypothetical protein
MAHEQNLFPGILFLKRADNEVLSEVRSIDTFDRIDALQPTRGLDQQLNYSPAPFRIARRRLNFNQGFHKRLNLSLPRLQGSKDLARNRIFTHLIVSLRTVNASIRGRLTAKPIPGESGGVIVPRALTVTGGSMMSSSQ